jgi:hypothetical protein
MITLIEVLADADEWNQIAAFAAAQEEWLKTFLKLPNGIPSHDRIQRVMWMMGGSMLYSLSVQFFGGKDRQPLRRQGGGSREDRERIG